MDWLFDKIDDFVNMIDTFMGWLVDKIDLFGDWIINMKDKVVDIFKDIFYEEIDE